MTNFIWFLTSLGAVFKWKLVIVYSSSSGVFDHWTYVKLLNIFPFVMGQQLTLFVGASAILELKVLGIRPAKRVQEKKMPFFFFFK